MARVWFLAMGILLCASLLVVFFLFPYLLSALHLRVSTGVSVYQNTVFSLKILNSWCCTVKVSEMGFDQKFFSSRPVVYLCESDSELIAINVFAKRRHLFVPFLRFNLLRFSYSCFNGTISSTGFHSLMLQWGSGYNEEEQIISWAHLLPRSNRMLLLWSYFIICV